MTAICSEPKGVIDITEYYSFQRAIDNNDNDTLLQSLHDRTATTVYPRSINT
jgi:hypothetical protein